MDMEMDDYFFYWNQTKEGGACILRGYGVSPLVVIPDILEGLPVTELADYCFADSVRAASCPEASSSHKRELFGDYIQKVVIPDSVTKLGDLAFYNCSRLQEIELGAGLRSIGSDAFMNCEGLEKLTIRAPFLAETGLRQLLDRWMGDLQVEFRGHDGVEGALFFPEYYEAHDLIGPAHIFALNIMGEGLRARQCIHDGIVDPAQYDAVFVQACAEESEETLCRMAFNRLRYPAALSQGARTTYERYLCKGEKLFMKMLVDSRDLKGMEQMVSLSLFSGRGLEEGIRLASESAWAEGAAWLLGWQQRRKAESKKKRYSFED